MESLESNIILLKSVPDSPGVYLLKDSAAIVFYVGKAKSLKKRLSSYFKKTPNETKSSFLGRITDSFEFIATENEIEALLLEETLIKKHRPKFNVRMKDDKSYPYIVITDEDYPRIIYTRNPKKNSSRFFGPYVDSRAAKSLVEIANNIFRLRRCRREIPLKEGERGCLNFQMGKCSGACVGKISKDEYNALVNEAAKFISGESADVIENLNLKMKDHAEKMEYERAAEIRNMIFDIQTSAQKQNVSLSFVYDKDCIACEIFETEAILLLFEFRSGNLSGRKIFVYENTEYSSENEIIETFILGHYSDNALPAMIATQKKCENEELLEKHFAAKKTGFRIFAAAGEDDRGIISMMKKNISLLKADREARAALNNTESSLGTLQTYLSLEKFPETIACFDISNFHGTDSVASMSFFRNGYPDKTSYRHFKIRAYDEANDPAMIHEALSRYLQNAVNDSLELPALVLIDGGPTQLARAQDAAQALGVDIAIVSIAKKHEEVFTDPQRPPVRIDHSHPALRLLQRIRDEAHRFGITHHRKLRSKRIISSALDKIDGIGEKRKKALLNEFGSVKGIIEAGAERISGCAGISVDLAEKVVRLLRSDVDGENNPS